MENSFTQRIAEHTENMAEGSTGAAAPSGCIVVLEPGARWPEQAFAEMPHRDSVVVVNKSDVTGVVTLPAGVEMVMPGDNVKIEAELIQPVAMEKELRFAIREGGKTVGAGVVTKILA